MLAGDRKKIFIVNFRKELLSVSIFYRFSFKNRYLTFVTIKTAGRTAI
jgi:hypothetical protein